MSIAEKMRTARISKGVSQETVARAIGVSWRTYANWENGKTSPGAMHLSRAAEYYGRSMEWFCRNDPA